MSRMFIKPVAGRTVRDPITYQILNPKGQYVATDGFWMKRIEEGDVVIADPPQAVEPIIDVIEKAKTKGVKNDQS